MGIVEVLLAFLRFETFEYPEKLCMSIVALCYFAFTSKVAFFRFRGGDYFFSQLSAGVDVV